MMQRTASAVSDAPPVSAPAARDTDAAPVSGVVEIGWVISGRVDEIDRSAIRAAHAAFQQDLRRWLPEFDWRMPLIERSDLPRPLREEPVELLELGVEERDARRWDFVLVVTAADLIAHRRHAVSATPSFALGVGVLSTARIDPQAEGRPSTPDERLALLTDRLRSLVVRVFTHVAGLEGDVLPLARGPSDLENSSELPEAAKAELRVRLRQVADARVEETSPHLGWAAHRVKAAWVNRTAILRAVRRARPWRFPLQFGRLSTAAGSVLLVLINTAEVWEVSLAQSLPRAVVLSALAVVATSAYVVHKQRLIPRGHARGHSEQAVVTGATLQLAVGLGMLATYAQIFVISIVFAYSLYPPHVVLNWASIDAIATAHYVMLAAYVASVAIVIGALGASFERQHHFRHVVYVDAEL